MNSASIWSSLELVALNTSFMSYISNCLSCSSISVSVGLPLYSGVRLISSWIALYWVRSPAPSSTSFS